MNSQWPNIFLQNAFSNTTAVPTVYTLPYGYNFQNHNNFLFLSPIAPQQPNPNVHAPPASLSTSTSQYGYQNQAGQNTINSIGNDNIVNSLASMQSKVELETNPDQSFDANANDDQEIRVIKQQPVSDLMTLERLQGNRDAEEKNRTLTGVVDGVPRPPKNAISAQKNINLIFSEVIRWKKVNAMLKTEEGEEPEEFIPLQCTQGRKRKRTLKTSSTKLKTSKRNKKGRPSKSDSVNDIDCDEENDDSTFEYGGTQNEFTVVGDTGEFNNEISQEPAEDKSNEHLYSKTNDSSWNLLDAIEKNHSAKNFHELAVENDDIKAFTTIKDLADRMTKEDALGFDSNWDQPTEESENLEFNKMEYTDPYDGNDDLESSIKSANKENRHTKKRVFKKRAVKAKTISKENIATDTNKIQSITPMWPLPPIGDERSQIFSEFTKKGKRRKRLPRRDLRQYLPKVNPILQKEGENEKAAPKTLDDYIVVRSAKAPRKGYTKYNTLDNPDYGNRIGTDTNDGEFDNEDEDTPDENEDIDIKSDENHFQKVSPRPQPEVKNNTYDGESQEDIESDEESQEDVEDTTKKKNKESLKNNNAELQSSTTEQQKFAAMHADRNTYGCMFCNYMAPKKEWLIHLKRKHRDKPLVFCTYVKFCNMPFEFMKDLDSHIDDIHSKHSQTGPRYREVKSYIEFEGEENQEEKNGGGDTKQQKRIEAKTHPCQYCDFRGIKRQWILHLKTKHIDKSLVFCEFSRSCSLPFETQELLDNHVQSFHLTNICDICGQEFKFRNVLREHKKIHIPEVSILNFAFI